jgi:hypothetical protein
MKLDARRGALLIVSFMLVSSGIGAISSGEFHSGYTAGQRTIVHLDGLGAYVIGVLLIGLGIFGGFRTFRR